MGGVEFYISVLMWEFFSFYFTPSLFPCFAGSFCYHENKAVGIFDLFFYCRGNWIAQFL